MISLFNKKIYKGGFDSAEEAADYYDILSINVFGLKVSFDSRFRHELTKNTPEHKF